jgi:hypothetical protein
MLGWMGGCKGIGSRLALARRVWSAWRPGDGSLALMRSVCRIEY